MYFLCVYVFYFMQSIWVGGRQILNQPIDLMCLESIERVLWGKFLYLEGFFLEFDTNLESNFPLKTQS